MYDAQWPREVRPLGLLKSSVSTPACRKIANNRGRKVEYLTTGIRASAGERGGDLGPVDDEVEEDDEIADEVFGEVELKSRCSTSAKSWAPGGGPSNTSTSPHMSAPRRNDPHTLLAPN